MKILDIVPFSGPTIFAGVFSSSFPHVSPTRGDIKGKLNLFMTRVRSRPPGPTLMPGIFVLGKVKLFQDYLTPTLRVI